MASRNADDASPSARADAAASPCDDGPRVIAVLATLDTKGAEAAFLREQIEALGGQALLIDMGVLGRPGTPPDITREEVASAGGTSLKTLLRAPTRQIASPVMVAGATKLLRPMVEEGRVHAVLALGGTQGTSNATAVMRALPYGFPKLMMSTVASGDVSSFVDIKDVAMMFSVGDILGLNPLTRKILANAAAAAWGMACSPVVIEPRTGDRPVIGLTNLGVLTDGAMLAMDLLRDAGHEVIVFHAVGAGGRAMEQLMKEGVIGAVFDYALGEIADELYDGLRAGGPERLTVAGGLGLPQVICPGGAEHIGLMVEADTVPERWAGHLHVFHNPIILAPRLDADEFAAVAREIGARLRRAEEARREDDHLLDDCVVMLPTRGTSRYAVEGGPLHDPESDAAFAAELERSLPASVELVRFDAGAEDEEFVRACVTRLLAMLAARTPD